MDAVVLDHVDKAYTTYGSCNRNPLFLTTGQSGSSLTNECLIPIRKFHDEFMNISLLCCLNDLFHRRIWSAIRNILTNTSTKQIYILLYQSDLFTKTL